MSALRVLVTRRVQRAAIERLEQRLEALRAAQPTTDPRHNAADGASSVIVHPSAEEPMPREHLLRTVAEGVDGIFCVLSDRIDAELLAADRHKRLKVVATMSVGVNHIDLQACRRYGVRVGYTPDVLTETTADLATGLLIATARRFREAVHAVESSPSGWCAAWSPEWMCGADVHGSTVGIVGLGRIGAAMARRLHHGFGCHILYTSGARGAKPELATAVGGPHAEHVALEELLRRADFVVPFAPLNERTRGMFGRAAFAAMKRSAILVNASRGELVDQDALYEALRDGEIAAAGIDVTVPEPLPSDSKLLQLRNLLVLPHIGSASERTRLAMAMMTVDNIVAGVQRGGGGDGEGDGARRQALPYEATLD